MLLGDFNVRVGFYAVSGGLDPEPPDSSTQLVIQSLHHLGMVLPNTYHGAHEGSSTTWTSPAGLERRLDYFAVDASAFSSVLRTWTDDSVHAGRASVDHTCLLMDCHLQLQCGLFHAFRAEAPPF